MIYTRNSKGSERSVDEQETECRAVCDRQGWTVERVVTDLVGASRLSKGHRKGWDEIVRAIGAREMDVLVTWECSRAQRDLTVYAQLRDLCAENQVQWCYSGRLHDLSVGEDRFRSGLDALLAEREADASAERIQRALRANAAAGRPHGRRLFGYQRVYDPTSGALVGQEPHPIEAAIVARIFADYLGGSGLRTIRRTLNDEQLRTGGGFAWTDTTVRGVLTNPAYIAQRVHHREVIGAANWPPLVPVATFDKAAARLAANRGTRQTRTARLLTGVARCGRCGGKMAVIHDRNHRKVYACSERFDVCRDERKLDAFVTTAILERLRRPTPPPVPAAAVDADRAVELQARLDSAVREFTGGRLSAGTLAAVEGDLRPQIAAAQAASRRQTATLELDVPRDVESWWIDQPRERQRAIAKGMIAAVVVHSTVRGSKTFDPDAVAIEWR